MAKPKVPPPFAGLYRDYDDSLREVLLAAGRLADCAQTLLDLDTIKAGREKLTKALREYRRAWDGGDGRVE